MNITKGFAVASVSGVMQAGIAVMVASSPMLRPVFDRTVGRVLGLSLQSRQHGNATTSNVTGGATGPSTAGRHSKHVVRNDGFKQMSDSEEHLAWELRNMGGSGGGRDSRNMGTTTTKVNVRRSDDTATEDDREVARDGKILVTRTTEVISG